MMILPVSYSCRTIPQQNISYGRDSRQRNKTDKYLITFLTGGTAGAAIETFSQISKKLSTKGSKMNWASIGIQAISFGAIFALIEMCFEFFGKIFNHNKN